jgi:hypothetical protein
MNEAEIREALVGKTILDVEFSDGTVFVWFDINRGFFVSAENGVFIGEVRQEGNVH